MTNTQKALALINTFTNGDTKQAENLLAANYIQHNLAYGTGREAFVGSVDYLASAPVKTTVKNVRAFAATVHQVLAQGNFVLAVGEGTFGGVPTAYYDLWRVENGKIAEHWDVMETIADKSTWQNQNGKF